MPLHFLRLGGEFVIKIETFEYFVATGGEIVNEFLERAFFGDLLFDSLVNVEVSWTMIWEWYSVCSSL